MRVLITGRGSIAKRHLQHLRALAPDTSVAVVAAAGVVDAAFQPCDVVPDLEQGFAWGPDAVVIASMSSRHAAELAACLRRGLGCLAEKPVALSTGELGLLRQAATGSSVPVQVGFNLRHLPVLTRLKELLQGATPGRLIRAQLEVGSDLAQWRPGRDLASSYSASAEQGGGVVFDLSHEIDMARWLLGPLQVKAAVGGRRSALPIQCDDVHAALLRTQDGAPVTIALDCVSQQPVRRYAFVAEHSTIVCDLMARELKMTGAAGTLVEIRDRAEFDIGQSYRAQMSDWLAALREPGRRLVSPLSEALDATELILAMKEAV